MSETIFSNFETVRYEGASSSKPLAYQWYDAERVVQGKPLKDHLRFAVAYWHSLAMTGSDPFGGPTIFAPSCSARLWALSLLMERLLSPHFHASV